MKKIAPKIQDQILFYIKKLNPIKQIEALDFVKWLWINPSMSEEFSSEEIKKMESLAKKRGGKKFGNWKDAKKYLESLMK